MIVLASKQLVHRFIQKMSRFASAIMCFQHTFSLLKMKYTSTLVRHFLNVHCTSFLVFKNLPFCVLKVGRQLGLSLSFNIKFYRLYTAHLFITPNMFFFPPPRCYPLVWFSQQIPRLPYTASNDFLLFLVSNAIGFFFHS